MHRNTSHQPAAATVPLQDLMKEAAEFRNVFPKSFRVGDRSVILRPLEATDREALITFARGLPEDDLLFLQRDITQPAEVDWWIREAAEGNLVTIVACQDGAIAGYATFESGRLRWTRHVAELRVVVATPARGLGLGGLMLELVFEMALAGGVTKLIARMTPSQTGAQDLFKRLGFEEEAVLRDHAVGANGIAHDLLVLSFRPRLHKERCCSSCGAAVLNYLPLEGRQLCLGCYELRYQELGGEG